MSMMFFYFFKIIFDISTSKRSKKYKPHSILTKKKIKIRLKAGLTAEPNRLVGLPVLVRGVKTGFGPVWIKNPTEPVFLILQIS